MTDRPTQIIDRRGWGALTPNTAHLTRVSPADERKIGATIHHTTGATLRDTDYRQWVRNIQREHMLKRGYGDIAYGTLIDPFGRVYLGRNENLYVGAHASSRNNQANRQTRGIAFLGNLNDTRPTKPAQSAAFWCFDLMRYAGDETMAFGHQDWAQYGPPAIATECPGTPDGEAWVKWVLRPHLGGQSAA